MSAPSSRSPSSSPVRSQTAEPRSPGSSRYNKAPMLVLTQSKDEVKVVPFEASTVERTKNDWECLLGCSQRKEAGSAPLVAECENTTIHEDTSDSDNEKESCGTKESEEDPNSTTTTTASQEVKTTEEKEGGGEEEERVYDNPQDLAEPRSVGNMTGNVWLEVCTEGHHGVAYCLSQGTIANGGGTFIEDGDLVTYSGNVITLTLPTLNTEWLKVAESILQFLHTKELTIAPEQFCIYYLLLSYLGIRVPNVKVKEGYAAVDVPLANNVLEAIKENAKFNPDNAIKRLSEMDTINGQLTKQFPAGTSAEAIIAQILFTPQRMEFERVVEALLDYPPSFLQYAKFSSESRKLHVLLRYIRSTKHANLSDDVKLQILNSANKSFLPYHDLLELQSTGLYDATVMAQLFSNLLDVIDSRHIPVMFGTRKSEQSNLVLDPQWMKSRTCGGATFIPKTQEVFLTGAAQSVVVQSFGTTPSYRTFSLPFSIFCHPPVYDDKDSVYFFERREARGHRQETHVSCCHVHSRECSEIVTSNTVVLTEAFAGCAVGSYICAVDNNECLCMLDTTRNVWVSTRIELGHHVHLLHGTGNYIYALSSRLSTIVITADSARKVWEQPLPKSFSTGSGVREAVVWKEPGIDVVLAVDNAGMWFSFSIPTETRDVRPDDALAVKCEESWTPVKNSGSVSCYAFFVGNTLHYISDNKWFCVEMAPSSIRSVTDGTPMVHSVPEKKQPQSRSFLSMLFNLF